MAKPHNAASQMHQGESPVVKQKNEEEGLKGTFASVMLLGLFLLLSWFGVFVLFIVRG
ncbi:cytochrome c oxidase subunit 2A [Paenibacillus oleatilyticus]|uniref:Cytochrome c oxidase subunit 2A n=1 Tax=Paenibacillus oleatilyticus TaxID=2594886 RepID=A0ABV4UVT9_9BACL|nr:cytochrome c oxidase subunit 2A [Paenibacillus oleatilyticus]MBU7314170.1 cytochrome c oxidase subunit 2A [Paenibacillus oleatilyticus]